MITLDTNLVLRLLLADDAAQLDSARKAIARADAAILLPTVLMEAAWVLQSRYGFQALEVATAFMKLGGSGGIQGPEWLSVLPEAIRNGLELDDAIHLFESDPDSLFLTFDKNLAARSVRILDRPKVITP
jgi:predicted nucleic acid-binding protein